MQARGTWETKPGFTGTLNRVRLGGEGTLPRQFSYRVLVEFEAGGTARVPAVPSLRDAYIRWTRGWGALQAGQFKTPFSRNFVTSLSLLETVDRPTVVDTLATKRDIGFMMEGTPIPEFSLSVGVFNGEGQNIPVNRDSTTLWVARTVVRPLPQVQLGASGATYMGDSIRWGLEGSLEQGGALLRGEYIRQHRRNHSQDDEGWFVVGAYRVVPWAQLVLQQEDLQRPWSGTIGNTRATTGGVNLDLGASRTRLTVEYIERRAGLPQRTRRTWLTQLQVRF